MSKNNRSNNNKSNNNLNNNSNNLKKSNTNNKSSSSTKNKNPEKKNLKKSEGKIKKELKLWQKILRVVLIVIGAFFLVVIGFFGWLTINEYKPADVEKINIDTSEGEGKKLTVGDNISILTWNMGYGALGDNADFFMDGGSSVMTATPERVDVNVAGFEGALSSVNPDIIFIQEIDISSKRSYNQNELTKIQGEYPILTKEQNKSDDDFNGFVTTFAYNFKAKNVPYPIPETIGKVESGIATMTKYEVSDAERISLPCPFSWPVRTVNLKRCLLVNRTPVYDSEGNATGKELVFINLHLEAYDSGEGKIAQTKQLKEFLQSEYDKGNYVIAGGDFNQTFSNVDTSAYPIHNEIPDVWTPGSIDVNDIGSDFQCLMDNTNPTCRSLDKPYKDISDKNDFQYYIIDGFIVSNNLKVDSINTYSAGFMASDHNPVGLSVTIEE